MKRLIKVKRRYENQILVKKNVIGCSVGLKQVDHEYTNIPSVVVYVYPKEDVDKKNFIPSKLNGVLTDVQEIKPNITGLGIISAYPYTYHSIIKEKICLEIQKVAAVEMNLRNSVDLAIIAFVTLDEIREAAKQTGLFIEELEEQLQHRSRSEPKPGGSIGRYRVPIESVYPGASTFMRALIRIHKESVRKKRKIFDRIKDLLYHLHFMKQCEFLPSEVNGIGEIKGFTKPKLGMKVLKSGRSTGVTEGIVVGIDASLFVDYPRGAALGKKSMPNFVEPILSPSPLDGGRFPSDIIGFFSGYVPITFPIDEKPNLCNKFHPAYKRALFIEQIVATVKAMPGDSGAPLVSNNLEAIGCLFACSANLSFYNTIKNLEEAFNRDMIKVDP